MTEPNQIESEIGELATVEKSHVNNSSLNNAPPSIYVQFNTETIPEPFNAEMISRGYAISKTLDNHSKPEAVYKNITDFGGS